MDWWTQNKDAIVAIVAALGVTGAIASAIWAVIKWGFLRRWYRKLRVDVHVFEVITNPTVLLPRLYATENDNSPLADHNIKYQPRDPNRDLQAELKTALNRSRYLMITAPTGYGKTREAGMLAQTMMLEGWRVLRIKNTGWLDIPKTLPEELNNNRSRVLIFLDDLNGLFSTGERTESPRVQQIPMLNETPYHDRLLQVLDMLEGMCTEKEIRVIATARSEADQWNLLRFNSRDRLWKRFERVELSEPTETTIASMLDDATKQVDLKANSDDFTVIAHKSDGTYRNILLNLRRWHAQNKEVNKDDFTETLDGSWRDIYERAIKQHRAAKYIYDAIDLLLQTGIWLEDFIIEPAALVIWGGNSVQKFIRKAQIQIALDYLSKETKVLRKTKGSYGEFSPSDGQIEAKGYQIIWKNYIFDLERLILNLKKPPIHYPDLLVDYLLFVLGFRCLLAKMNEQAIKIWQKIHTDNLYNWFKEIILRLTMFPGWKNILQHSAGEDKYYFPYFCVGILLEIFNRLTEAEDIYQQIIARNPNNVYAYTELGDTLRELKRYGESEVAYRQAIAKNPNYAHAYSRLGSLLRKLRRYAESESAYYEAIKRDPNDVFAYSRFGVLLTILERYPEAETIFRQAIDKEPNKDLLSNIYSDFGYMLEKQERDREAEAAYRKAIELNSRNVTAHKNLVNLLRYEENNRQEEALALLEKLIEINPENFYAYLAISSIRKELGKPISIDYIERVRQLLAKDDWYNLACLESVCNNFDFAFDYLQLAKRNEKLDRSWAWKDPDLQWIRGDPRFEEIVGSRPENNNSEA